MVDLLSIARDIAKGCQYLEENQFIHRWVTRWYDINFYLRVTLKDDLNVAIRNQR